MEFPFLETQFKLIERLKETKEHIKHSETDPKFSYIHNIAKFLDDNEVLVFDKKLKDLPDIKKKIYEGGFKIWECELDGLKYISDQHIDFKEKRVLEIGCGSGLMALYCLLKNAQKAIF